MSTWKKIFKAFPGYNHFRKKYHAQHLKKKSTDEVFKYIYERNLWGNTESVSGGGSTLEYTQQLRSELEEFIRNYSIYSILDIPCGDFNWIQKLDLSNLHYIGADIVPAIVQYNREKFSKPGTEFIQLDIIRDTLPKVDLIFCKDLFVHFSFDDIHKAIKNISQNGSNYIAITNFDMSGPNKDIITGEWRLLDLRKPPFNFPEPLIKLTENLHDKKYIFVWKIADIKALGINA